MAAYEEVGNISRASEIANVARQTHYEWLTDEQYANAFAAAHKVACDSLKREARRRAVEGVDKPVYYKGERIDTLKEYSDTLLIFLMKGAMPEEYKDRVEHGGNEDKPIRIVVEHIGSSAPHKASA